MFSKKQHKVYFHVDTYMGFLDSLLPGFIIFMFVYLKKNVTTLFWVRAFPLTQGRDYYILRKISLG